MSDPMPGKQHGAIASRLLLSLVLLGAMGFIAVKIAQTQSDGPLNNMLPGGALEAGNLVSSHNVSWPQLLGDAGACQGDTCAPMAPVELQLVDPATSRWTGIMVHEGKLYIPCDLGFMWGRFEGNQRHILHLIYLFKRWHEDALADGRAVVRIAGTRYSGQLERVTDTALDQVLRHQLEDMARAWVAPDELGPPPIDGPRDIWFFEFAAR